MIILTGLRGYEEHYYQIRIEALKAAISFYKNNINELEPNDITITAIKYEHYIKTGEVK